MRKYLLLATTAFLFSCHQETKIVLKPVVETPSLPGDADDCAIWVHPTEPQKTLVFGNDKESDGALYTWDLNGKEVAEPHKLKKSINLDVRNGFKLQGEEISILAIGLRSTQEIKVFAIDPQTGVLTDITTPEGISTGHARDSYGFALYKNQATGEMYAFVSAKEKADIHQIKLEDDGTGKVKGTLVRKLSGKDQKDLVEGIVADDALGYLYCSDEEQGILKYHAGPEKPADLISIFGKTGFEKDREGIALYSCPDGTGYILVSNQEANNVRVFQREGNNDFVATLETEGSTETDGLDVTSQAIPGKFPEGFLVAHNDKNKSFVYYDWQEAIKGGLKGCKRQ